MNYTLDTPSLSIEITKTGIELCSIKSKKTGKEYMWQGNPAIWGSNAPVLFPIIGALKNGECLYNGKSYAIPKHGLIRNSDRVKLVKRAVNSLTFSLKWNAESLQLYPFKFEIEVTYSIIGNTIQVNHLITNHDTESMLYSVGGHPAFNCPIHEEESYEDCFLEFEKPETDSTWMLDSNGLITGETKPMLKNSIFLPLHKDTFDDDALIFKNIKSRIVSLKSKLSGDIITVRFKDFDYLGIWAKPNAPFVCIEPWLGITDYSDSNQKFENKEGLLKLAPGNSDHKTYSITIDE